MRRAKAFLSKIVTGAFAQTMTLRLVQRRLEVGALSTFLELGTLSRFEASYFKTPTTPPHTLTHTRARTPAFVMAMAIVFQQCPLTELL